MTYRGWFAGIILGFAIGSCVGFAQLYLFEKPKYIALVTLNERVLFDEYWSAAPDVLVKAELRRVDLSSRSRDSITTYEATLVDLLNEWFRLLDETLFRFPIDEALKSNALNDEVKRYARLNRGVTQGLNQRSISFRVIGEDAGIVERELLDWVSEVQTKSTELAHQATKSWLMRKSMSLKALSERGGIERSDDTMVIGRMADGFRMSADKFEMISPFEEKLSEVEVVLQPRPWALRAAVWGLIGSLLSLVIVASLRAKRPC